MLSARASGRASVRRRGNAAREVAKLQRIGLTVTEILNQAARLAADDLDGSAVDETAQKDSSRLLEQIHAHIRDLDTLLGTRAAGRVQTVKALAGTAVPHERGVAPRGQERLLNRRRGRRDERAASQ